jgi:hypothetical protein
MFRLRPKLRFATAIWPNYAPNKCRLFLWLSKRQRLFTMMMIHAPSALTPADMHLSRHKVKPI